MRGELFLTLPGVFAANSTKGSTRLADVVVVVCVVQVASGASSFWPPLLLLLLRQLQRSVKV